MTDYPIGDSVIETQEERIMRHAGTMGRWDDGNDGNQAT